VYPDENGNQGSESVEGTFVVRSAIAGAAGKITFASENQDLLNAFAFNTIQEATGNIFTASVFDAHSGKVLVSNALTQGNTIGGVLGPNTSIEFDTMANVKASWDEASKRYILSSEDGVYTTTLHVRDRSTSFQIGQAEGQDIYLNIGDMRSDALGLGKVNVMTRENAAKSITLLDAAIHKVGVQRSRIGAYQNELEYNMNNLTQTGLHLQESESRIKDADMAKEYMEFVKFQILNQTGNSMMSSSSRDARAAMNLLTM
jgi:flagellin